MENGSFLNSENFDAIDLRFKHEGSEFKLKPTGIAKKQRKTQREERRFTKLSVRETKNLSFIRETEAITRKVPLVRSSKQVIVLIFIFL